MFPIPKADLASTKCPIFQQQEARLNAWYGIITRGDLPTSWWQVYYIGQLISWMKKDFLFAWIDTLDMDLPSLLTMLPSRLSSLYLQNTLSMSCYSTQHCFLAKNSPHNKIKWSNGSMLMKLTILTMFPIMLMQLVWWPFEVTISLQEAISVPNQFPVSFFHSQDYRSYSQGPFSLLLAVIN